MLRLGLCQTRVHRDKAASVAEALAALRAVAADGARMAVLGEMFCSRYHPQFFREYSEEGIPGVGGRPESPALGPLAACARELKLWVVAGSVPEFEPGTQRIFNTAVVIDDEGKIAGKYRKSHLFDIDVPPSADHPGIRFFESETLSPGDLGPCWVKTPCLGLGICYDLRFPEYSLSLRHAADDVRLLVFPGAFNMTTGPLHWELLARARAVDNQCFLVAASPARSADPEDYQAWGHSMVVSPWGRLLGSLEAAPGNLVVDVDLGEADKMRRQIPTSAQKRHDLYPAFA